mmetsp:Transcript_26035/g.42983  ORF Transcript_26035/g.42983 Transcript_26035/m.42983 type:complete len:377 (-) Transcript_26035:57-1187(-)
MTEAVAVVNTNITTDNTVQVSTSMAMTSKSVKDAIDDSVKVSTTITAPTDSATTEEAIAVGANDLHAATSHDTSDASSPSVRSSDMCPSNADATGEFTRDNCNHMLDLPMKDNHLPRVTPCSLHPSYWSKQRIRVTTIGCLTSAIVCIIRLVVNHESTAYIIHSFIVFFDLILIHIFTYTPWLSIAGESTAIVFATTYYFTHERIFELLETTLIAVFVSMHMIQSRDEHWGREEGLRERVIGLQLHIEQFLVQHDVSSQLRRCSSVSMTEEHDDAKSDPAVEEVDIEVGGQDVHKVHLDVLSSINSTINTSEVDVRRQNRLQVKQEDVELGKESRRVWCKIAFDHFLDGSAGVLYTSFFGLILDEIVTFGTDKYQK